MIKGVHAMFDSTRSDQLRAFMKDKLGLHDTDVGDDLKKTVADRESRGVAFDNGAADHDYGFVNSVMMPGGVKVLPRHHAMPSLLNADDWQHVR